MVSSAAIAFAILSFAASAQAQDSPAGMSVTLYPNERCSDAGYYDTVDVAEFGKCAVVYKQDPNFTKGPNGRYMIYFAAPTFSGDYEIIIQTPPQNNIPGSPCGYAAQSLVSGECQLVEVDDMWYINACATQGDNANCPGLTRRDLANATAPSQEREEKPYGVHMSQRRADCNFDPSDPNYGIQAGTLQRITELYDNSNSEASSTVELSSSQTTGSTNSFGVEAGASTMFDIVQASISFSYTYSYEQSRTITSDRSFTFPAGQAGYGAFIPYYECVSGSFAGSECNDIQTGQDGTVCIPKLRNGNKDTPDGEYRTVQT